MPFAPRSNTRAATDPVDATGLSHQTLCAVHLIDRRTGSLHRVNGRPLLMLTRKPQDAVTELMVGRDPAIWETRIEAIEQIARKRIAPFSAR